MGLQPPYPFLGSRSPFPVFDFLFLLPGQAAPLTLSGSQTSPWPPLLQPSAQTTLPFSPSFPLQPDSPFSITFLSFFSHRQTPRHLLSAVTEATTVSLLLPFLRPAFPFSFHSALTSPLSGDQPHSHHSKTTLFQLSLTALNPTAQPSRKEEQIAKKSQDSKDKIN